MILRRKKTKRMLHMSRVVAVASSFLVCSCFPFFAHNETLVARYKLVAIDVKEDMSLCWALDNGNCAGDGLPGPTVFAAGFNDRYVVAAVHPATSGKSITQFFYIIRNPADEDKDSGLPYKDIKGPFGKEDYESAKARLHLPDFSRVFDDLK